MSEREGGSNVPLPISKSTDAEVRTHEIELHRPDVGILQESALLHQIMLFHRCKLLLIVAVLYSYSGARTSEGFLEFIEKSLAADKGFARIPGLDTIAATFASSPNPKKVLDELTVRFIASQLINQRSSHLQIKCVRVHNLGVSHMTSVRGTMGAWCLQ